MQEKILHFLNLFLHVFFPRIIKKKFTGPINFKYGPIISSTNFNGRVFKMPWKFPIHYLNNIIPTTQIS